MPPVRSLDPYDKRKKEFRKWLDGQMGYHQISQKELSRKTGIPASTLSYKVRKPERMTLLDLWRIEKVLGRMET